MPDSTLKRDRLMAEIRRMAEIEAMPVDFAKLESDAVLQKRGAWYEVLDVTRIPATLMQRVKSMKQATRRSAEGVKHGPLLVQFRKANPRLLRLVDRQ